ncbi:Spy/CpxP family protein refolding chaperone [Roseinatronobacter sp. NSM]|uniref:Spy/CpxP family protein refolding chaperone n=1 Tax=Roseinatronobacter sp. NSM TaxID=3457785 RepID=UPI0040365CCA
MKWIALLAVLLCPIPALAQDHAAHSAYAGFETRAIKSLSDADLDDLRRGAGWGLALSAELNGVPGPAHLLDLKDQIGLSTDQVTDIEEIFAAMQSEAQDAGLRFIEAEAAIEAAFRAGNLDREQLRDLIQTSGAARAELRFIHLVRHLDTPTLLSSEQIARYNALRGYSESDPCDMVPDGHDPAMWRRHNGCDG